MADESNDSSSVAASWDNYWSGTSHGTAYSSGGTSHPLVLSFWDCFFETVKSNYDAPRIVDVASGNGAVVERAQSVFDGQLSNFTCLDISESAIEILTSRFAGVHGIVADAHSIPQESESCDIVTSQFGVEYAGLEAIDEATRLLAPGGQIALLLHKTGGGIYRQCAASRDAIEKMLASRFIPQAITMLETGFAAYRGADRRNYDEAAKNIVPAVRAMESIIRQYGKSIADGTIQQLYVDVTTINRRIPNYDPKEVLSWLEKMHVDVQAFLGRMVSMCDSAIDDTVFAQLCDKLQNQGYKIHRSDPLADKDKDVHLAWALVAAKA